MILLVQKFVESVLLKSSLMLPISQQAIAMLILMLRFLKSGGLLIAKHQKIRNAVTFELASKFDVAGQKLPKRQCIANICQWEYRSSECGYTGSNFFDMNDNAAASLGKRLSSCKLRFGENDPLPFGSFPSVGLSQ